MKDALKWARETKKKWADPMFRKGYSAGYRAGIEALRKDLCECETHQLPCYVCERAELLLTEQEQKEGK